MDLVGAESRKTGTRGGRNEFSWDNVHKRDREFYLGNSVAGVRARWAMPDATETKPNDDLSVVRRREKAVMDAALSGTRSFAEAVRSALVDSVDDERNRDEMEVVPKTTKAERKEVRRRRREERRLRREARQKRREERAARADNSHARHDSTESEREGHRSRLHDGHKRRRKERETGRKRTRSDLASSSDMNDSDAGKNRRMRLR